MKLHSSRNPNKLRLKLLGEVIVMQGLQPSNSDFRVNSGARFGILNLNLIESHTRLACGRPHVIPSIVAGYRFRSADASRRVSPYDKREKSRGID